MSIFHLFMWPLRKDPLEHIDLELQVQDPQSTAYVTYHEFHEKISNLICICILLGGCAALFTVQAAFNIQQNQFNEFIITFACVMYMVIFPIIGIIKLLNIYIFLGIMFGLFSIIPLMFFYGLKSVFYYILVFDVGHIITLTVGYLFYKKFIIF